MKSTINTKTEKRSEMRIKQVNVGHINFIDIVDHPQIYNWMKYLCRRDAKTFNRLFCDNNELRLQKLIGKNLPDVPKTFNPGWGNCWRLYSHHLTWLIFSGTEGTIFLVETSLTQEEFQLEVNIGIAIINFLEEFKNKLCNSEI